MSKETLTYLKNLPPFKDLEQKSIEVISDSIEDVKLPVGQIVFKAGDDGDSLYIIKKGTVQIFIEAPETNERIILSKLSEGDYFGEMSLITNEPRSAGVETLSAVELLRLNKKGFDRLLRENPQVSLSLSHMLSQRLKNANIQRVESEKQYHKKISRSGTMEETPFYEVLKFCEQNSLTGRLLLENNQEKGKITFLKGNVQSLSVGEISDAEAMDALMQWKKGTFVIEPKLFSPEDEFPKKKSELPRSEEPIIEMPKSEDPKREEPIIEMPKSEDPEREEPIIEKSKSEDPEKEEPIIEKSKSEDPKKEEPGIESLAQIFENVTARSFDRLISIIGSQTLNETIETTRKQLLPFFPVIDGFKFEIIPKVNIGLDEGDGWNDKNTLAVAVFLQSVIKNCAGKALGMEYFDVKEIAAAEKQQLEDLSFFQYMEHAAEFVG